MRGGERNASKSEPYVYSVMCMRILNDYARNVLNARIYSTIFFSTGINSRATETTRLALIFSDTSLILNS